MALEFPRQIVRVGDCIAVLGQKGRWRDRPITGDRQSIRHDGKMWIASRLSYHLNVAHLPTTPRSFKDGLVLHSCDNGWCVNPEHLRLGTVSENARDLHDRQPEKSRRIGQNRAGKKNSPQHNAAISAAMKARYA